MNDEPYIEKQLSSRKTDQVGSLFISDNFFTPSIPSTIILEANNDIGVARNGGRIGSSYAPKSIVEVFKKMTSPHEDKGHQIYSIEVNGKKDEKNFNFNKMQENEAQRIEDIINKLKFSNLVHLGGGHDHIYPLLLALSKNYKKIKILNLDAHLDTRMDQAFHSGTPLRQAMNIKDVSLSLHQWGIKNSANIKTSYQNLEMEIIDLDKILKTTISHNQFMNDNFYKSLDHDELILLSLDTDAINSSSMEAVSAVNPTGLSYEFVKQVFLNIKSFCNQNNHPFICGIYEYNPIFDNLSNKGSRLLADLIYSTIFINKHH